MVSNQVSLGATEWLYFGANVCPGVDICKLALMVATVSTIADLRDDVGGYLHLLAISEMVELDQCQLYQLIQQVNKYHHSAGNIQTDIWKHTNKTHGKDTDIIIQRD